MSIDVSAKRLAALAVITAVTGCGSAPEDTDGRTVAEWVVSRGGRVELVGRDIPVQNAGQIPEGPFAIRGIDLAEKPVTATELQQLESLKHLRSLTLYQSGIGDDALPLLASLKGLETLELSYTRVTGAGIDQLGDLSSLKTLFLRGTAIDDEAVESLRKKNPDLNVVLD